MKKRPTLKIVVTGGPGDETLTGTADADQLDGAGGNDILLGLAGDDTMIGGTGDDVFHVEDAGDILVELLGEGSDRVAAYLSYTLAAGVEIERLDAVHLTETTAIDLTGNEFAQTVIGNFGANTLDGGGGNDQLLGLDGNDRLIGGTGVDIMFGGTGDDLFFVDDAADSVTELVGEGYDRISASVSYILSNDAEIERLESLHLDDTADISLTGNDFVNHLVGNVGSNRLDGGAGNDRIEAWDGDDILIGGTGADQMFGGLGNDTYYVDNSGDRAAELSSPLPSSGGIDRVATSISFRAESGIEILEAVNLTDTTPINLRTVSLGANTITGNMGDNVIEGGGGADLLTGLGGADTFVFRHEPSGSTSPARIIDFLSGTDKIAIENFGFHTNLPTGPLSPSAFALGAPQDASDRVIYNNGQLLWDEDGTGNAQAFVFATLDGSPLISASDFIIIGTADLVT